MSDATTPREIAFGEIYEDGSGYLWRVALIRKGGAEWDTRIEVGESGATDCQWIDPKKVSVRAIAAAFNQIADLLGEDQ